MGVPGKQIGPTNAFSGRLAPRAEAAQRSAAERF